MTNTIPRTVTRSQGHATQPCFRIRTGDGPVYAFPTIRRAKGGKVAIPDIVNAVNAVDRHMQPYFALATMLTPGKVAAELRRRGLLVSRRMIGGVRCSWLIGWEWIPDDELKARGVVVNNAETIERRCVDCGVSIDDRGRAAKRCVKCAEQHSRSRAVAARYRRKVAGGLSRSEAQRARRLREARNRDNW